MARGVNKVILIGNIGADPDSRRYPDGSPVTSIRLATSEQWRDKESGENKERVEWHKVVFSGGLADIAGSMLKKGSRVYVEGSIRSSKYEKQGVEVTSYEIRASSMEILGGFDSPAPAPAPAPASSGGYEDGDNIFG